jgi:hypothetical protein
MVMKTWIAVGGSIAAAMAILVGCNAVLGIDEAKIDPALDGAVDGSSGDDGGGGPATCAGYCAAIMQNCTGKDQEYVRVETCLEMCKHFEPGILGDMSNDSLECRNYHAHVAADDPDLHCRHAGPLGGGTCGTNVCNPYCALVSALCGSMMPPPYPSESACKTSCMGFTYLDQGDAGDLTFTAQSDTLNCRIYHLESAYDPTNNAAASTHCPHTGVVSAPCSVPMTDGGSDAPND